MGISADGLISGLNTADIISQLLALQRRPIEILQSSQKTFETRLAALLDVNVKVSSLKNAAAALNDPENFNTKTISVTKGSNNDDLVTATVNNAAVTGSHTIEVSQLAQAHKVASQGFTDENTTAVASGSGKFSFKIGASGAVTTIDVTSTTKLQELRDAINSANAGVTASILNDGSSTNPYRLILNSNATGAANDITIVTNDTTLDFTNKQIEEAAVNSANSGSYTGTVTSSGTYTGTTNKSFLIEIMTAGTVDGTARYKVSTDGGVTFDDNGGLGYSVSATASAIGNNTEGVNIAFSNAGTLSVGDQFSVDVFNPTLQEAQDAIVKIDTLTLVKSSNTITDAIQGVTLNLAKAETGKQVNLTVSASTSSASSKINEFVGAYNEVMDFLDSQQRYDPEVGIANPLLGDFTIRTLQQTIQNTITGIVPGLSSGKLNIAQVGITSDSNTGKLSVNDSELSAALSSNANDVLKLFVGTGTPSNSAITFSNKSDKTKIGAYPVFITTAAQKADFTSATQLQTTGLGSDELLTFTFSGNATSSTPTTTSFTVTLSQNDTINTVVSTLNSAFATENVALEASHDNGKLSIKSKDYGADLKFTVVSDQPASTTSTGIGQTVQTGIGVDIAGTINGHAGTGKGDALTGLSGSAEDGLIISSRTTSTGDFGTVTVSSGVADQLEQVLAGFLDPLNGVMKSRQDTIQNRIDQLSEQIAKKEEQLTRQEERLRAQFASLEVVLGQFKSQSDFLSNQLKNLPTISSSR
jgi:flagellar hook-associated protein 2